MMADVLSSARVHCHDGAALVAFCDWRQLPLLADAVQWAGWMWRGTIVWDNMSSRQQRGRFRQQAEFAIWASNGKLPIDRIGHLPTRVLVYVVSLIVLLLVQLFTAQAFTPEVVALAALNAVIVSFAAMGAYERAIALPEAQKNDELVEAARLLSEEGIELKAARETETEKNGELTDAF